MSEEKRNIVGFKKFSDIKKSKMEEVDLSLQQMTDSDLPANPNLPKDSKKYEKPADTKKMKPEKTTENPDMNDNIEIKGEKTHEQVNFSGKIAKFPKNIKASKAYNFMENVKISKKSIWYIMIEKDNELQMIKYNYKEGVDLNKFVNELKNYYLNKYKENSIICEAISKLNVDGNDKYSMIKGISPIEIDDKKLITKITEDLIKLLSK